MKKSIINKALFLLLLLINVEVYAKEFIIEGNEYTDKDIVISIIDKIPDIDVESQTNYILKKLISSNLFKSVKVSYDSKNYIIKIIEYPSINNFFYINNERIKDTDIDNIVKELEINTLSDSKINELIQELSKIYQSFGYNNIQIEFKSEDYSNNSSDIYLYFNEGKITKINKINIIGNNTFDKNIILSKIKSKTKKITNIFANNNFKLFELNNDIIRIKNFYKSKGYKDVRVEYSVEYFSNNKVEINLIINEGNQYFFSALDIKNNLDNNVNLDNQLSSYIDKSQFNIKSIYHSEKIDEIEYDIAEILENEGFQYFKITAFEKIDNYKADILFEISPTEPVYVNQINISGNDRTYDYVFRREFELAEGDPINDSKIKKISRKLNNLNFIGNAKVETNPINENSQNIDIIVEETQTGSFNVGFSIGTLDGASFVSGLKENNINGTGRTLEFLVNTNNNNKEFVLSTSDKLFINNNVNHGYSINYKENDFSKSQSYKLNSLTLDTNFKYEFSDNTYHTIGIGYSLKDYQVTDDSTVTSIIKNSKGESISFNLSNDFTINTLNSYIKPTRGNFLSFANFIETPSSSNNGFIKNIITGKKYYTINKNIFSAQGKVGNIFSLNDSTIYSDNKFSLGGRWLRGFDSFGVGPRDSRTSYIGGNNVIALKLDLSRPITLNDQNPIYLNLFNDYGSVWGNKDQVTFSDQDLRVSYGFGINYFSPIGPIGFSWGFPLVDKDYDIKRMFLFSIGNLN
ncbi:MAG: outer membrane protein assembly factor BamA [Alphaproteobacteria bacterium]|nr:outer membrane protein assembly factor BamA [Alphaproteobacteria bacterium]